MGVIRHMTTGLNALPWPVRLTLFVAALAVIASAWYVLLMAPLAQHQRNLQREAARVQARIADLREHGGREARAPSPAADRQARIAAIKFDIDRLDHRIKRIKDQMIDPRRMMTVLHSLLTRNTRLTLVSIESLAPKPLVDKRVKASAREGMHHVFMHGVRIRFQGGYLETLRYLKALEALPWRLFWGELDYDVRDYPRGEGTLVVYTMSMEPGWIGA